MVEVRHEICEDRAQPSVFHMKLAREQDCGNRGYGLDELELRSHEGAKPIDRIDRAALDGVPALLELLPDASRDRFPQILLFREMAETSGLRQPYRFRDLTGREPIRPHFVRSEKRRVGQECVSRGRAGRE